MHLRDHDTLVGSLVLSTEVLRMSLIQCRPRELMWLPRQNLMTLNLSRQGYRHGHAPVYLKVCHSSYNLVCHYA